RRMSDLVRGGAFAALLLGLFVCAGAAQEPLLEGRAERKKALLEGTHVFRRLLHDAGCTPLENFEALGSEDPKDVVLIILGDLDRIVDLDRVIRGGLGPFVRKGGAVLLASDRPLLNPDSARDLEDLSGVRNVDAQTLVLAGNVQKAYKHLPFCPVLEFDPNA